MAFAVRRRNAEDRAGEEGPHLGGAAGDPAGPRLPRGPDRQERSDDVAAAYRKLVSKTREIAGGIVKRSWDEDPITSDDEITSPGIASELQALTEYETAYMDAVADDVGGQRSDG